MSLQRDKKPTIHDVARLANVSHATVTQALKMWTKASIKPETRERVLAAVAELGYRPSLMAQQLKTRRSRAVLLPIGKSPFEIETPIGGGEITLILNDMVAGANSVLLQNGLRLEPFYCGNTEEDENTIVQLFLAGYFDAAIMPHLILRNAVEQLAQKGCLVVTCWPAQDGLENLIHVPARSWGRTHLPQIDEVVRQGRTRILLMFPVAEEVQTKYAEEIRSGKLHFESFKRSEGSLSRDINAIVRKVLSEPIDAIVTSDEFFGWEIFKVLHQSGVSVPERVTVTGAGDARHIFKQLPILQLNYAEKAQAIREMASRLVEELGTRTSASYRIPPQRGEYQPRLQVLSSEEFHAAAQAELRRERIQQEIEEEILENMGGQQVS